MQISIETNFPQVQRAIEKLRDDIAAKATARAVNGTIAQAKTAMRKEIRAEFNISAAKVNEKLHVTRASFRGGVLRVSASLYSRAPDGTKRSINVINFQARQVGKGVSVKVLKHGGRKVIKSAFIANAGRTVFERTSEAKATGKRLPIRPVQAVDVPQMFNTRRINRKVVEMIKLKFPEVFEREAAYYLRKFNGA